MPEKNKKDKSINVLFFAVIAMFVLDFFVAGYFIINAVGNSESHASDSQKSAVNSQIVSGTAARDFIAATTTTVPVEEADSIVENMTLHEKVCQMFIVRPEKLTNNADTTTASEATKESLEAYPVGGLVYFGRNLESQTQIRNVITQVKGYASDVGCLPLFFSVDEEGGRVSRCADTVGTTSFDSMFSYRSMGRQTAYANARTIAGDIASLGFNLDFAPVADTWTNPNNQVIGERAYSDNYIETAELISYAVKGFRDGGVFCSLKHFPGHGDTADDSHNGSVYSYRTADNLRINEYIAFSEGIAAGADMVMVGHITVPDLDSVPASLSRNIIMNELRGLLGFDGVVITDSLEMRAVSEVYGNAELAVMAVEAGNDILLTPESLEEAVAGIENAVSEGRISEERINESVKRIVELKSKKMEMKK